MSNAAFYFAPVVPVAAPVIFVVSGGDREITVIIEPGWTRLLIYLLDSATGTSTLAFDSDDPLDAARIITRTDGRDEVTIINTLAGEAGDPLKASGGYILTATDTVGGTESTPTDAFPVVMGSTARRALAIGLLKPRR